MDQGHRGSKNHIHQTQEEERWKNSIKTLLNSTAKKEFQPRSIPVVPDKLRKSNEDAYKPKVVSIGPIHYGASRDLLYMEELKWNCMLSLLWRTQRSMECLDSCCDLVLGLDEEVRASYSSEIQLNAHDLAKIMLVDGCFLLEFFITSYLVKNDFSLDKSKTLSSPALEIAKNQEVLADLRMLENQIPFLVLKKLFQKLDLAMFNDLINMALAPFGCSCNRNSISDTGFAHLLDLLHSSELDYKNSMEMNYMSSSANVVDLVESKMSIENSQTQTKPKPKCCATRLRAVGIKITPAGENPVNTRAESADSELKVDVRFECGALKISRLCITETTEIKWRNFIAWEHSKTIGRNSPIALAGGRPRVSCKFIFYAFLFNGLICCAHDIELLKESGIIENRLKMSNEDLRTLFRSITEGLDYDDLVDSSYTKMWDQLNSYQTKNRATYMRIMLCHQLRRFLGWLVNISRSTYNLLNRGYNFAATAISLLTIVQTFYAVLSYHYPKK